MKICLPELRRPGTRRTLAGALGLLLALGMLVSSAVPALAETFPGHTFWGAVTINGVQAPNGTPVDARIDGDVFVTGVVTDGGYLLKVPGDDPGTELVKEGGAAGDTVDFFVNGIEAGSYTPFSTSGQFTSLDLAAVGDAPVTYDLEVTSSGCCDILVEYDAVSETVEAGTTETFYDILEDTDVDLTVDESGACTLTCWEIDGVTSAATNPLMVTMDDDHSVVATCEVVTMDYDLVVTSSGCCDILVSYGEVSDTVDAGTSQNFYDIAGGTSVCLTAQPINDCQFNNWLIDGTNYSYDNPVDIVMNGNHTIVSNCSVDDPQVEPILNIALVQGWNTFSIPIALDPAVDTWGEFIAYNSLSIDALVRFDAELKIWVNCQSGDLLKQLEGYYMHTTSADTAAIIPYPDQTSQAVRHLYPGVNFIGVSSLTDAGVTTLLYTVYDVNTGNGIGYQMVHNPPVNGGGWNYIRDGMSPPVMQVGKAYWVVMLNSGELVGFTSTPLQN